MLKNNYNFPEQGIAEELCNKVVVTHEKKKNFGGDDSKALISGY